MEPSRYHIGQHAGVYNIDIIGQKCQVTVSIIYMEVFGEYAILEVGELPTCQHTAGVHGISCLCLQRVPVRGDCRYKNAVAGLEIANQLTDFYYFCAALMTKDHIVAITDRALPEGMYI